MLFFSSQMNWEINMSSEKGAQANFKSSIENGIIRLLFIVQDMLCFYCLNIVKKL